MWCFILRVGLYYDLGYIMGWIILRVKYPSIIFARASLSLLLSLYLLHGYFFKI